MLLQKFVSLEPFMIAFYTFVFQNRGLSREYSYRELHLMFYYYYLYNKIWDGTEWVILEQKHKTFGG
jgi:hypothetical protein